MSDQVKWFFGRASLKAYLHNAEGIKHLAVTIYVSWQKITTLLEYLDFV